MAIVNETKSVLTVKKSTAKYIGSNTIHLTPEAESVPNEGDIILTLYQNTAEQNRLDKTDYLTEVGTIYGTFREPTSITDPSITIESGSVPNFNYVYIDSFKRYYYVTNITSIRKNLWQIDMSVDVLMSYKDAILQCPARVERNQFDYNSQLPDNRRIVECGSEITDTQISNTAFNQTGEYQYVMNGYKLDAVVG